MRYPKWSELSEQEKLFINNGCGPTWLPYKYKRFLTSYLMAWAFFASCGHHDFGYTVGGSERRRLYCDFRFGLAMLDDLALCFKHKDYKNFFLGLIVGLLFFLSVVFFGWLSFEYGPIKTKSEVLVYLRAQEAERNSLFARLKNYRL